MFSAVLVSVMHCMTSVSSGSGDAFGRATDWAAPVNDAQRIAVADVNNDGFGDVLFMNAKQRLSVAYSVNGWKSAPPTTLQRFIDEGAIDILGVAQTDDARRRLFLVVYASHIDVFGRNDDDNIARTGTIACPEGMLIDHIDNTRPQPIIHAADGSAWTCNGVELIAVEAPTSGIGNRPDGDIEFDPPSYGPTHTRMAIAFGDVTGDGVDDAIALFESAKPKKHRVIRIAPGLNPDSDDRDDDGLSDEDETAIGSDPTSRDTDGDGLLDGWEVHGLPREIVGPDTELSPVRQDVIVSVSPYENPGRRKVEREINKSKRLFAELNTMNPDGSTGITLHYRFNDEVPKDEQGSWSRVGRTELPPIEFGIMHWMQVTPGGGGQAQQLGTMGQSGNNWAAFAHEVGHQLGLSHTGDSSPVWCPIYPSIMNYAYNYSRNNSNTAIGFSDGSFVGVELLETALIERLPFPIDKLGFLSKRPYRFSIKDDGDGGTLIDWNHNGRFDTEPVVADINYGSSTNAGKRFYQDLVAGKSTLAYVGDTCLVFSIDKERTAVSLRNYLGDNTWSEHRTIDGASPDIEGMLIGGDTWGTAFVRAKNTWTVCRVNAESIEPLHKVKDLPLVELSGVSCGTNEQLLIARHDDNRLEAFLCTWNDGVPTITALGALQTTSQVAPGIARHPFDGTYALVTAMPNSNDVEKCLRVTTLQFKDNAITEGETVWARGETSGHRCTTRPSPDFTPDGELVIFHTGRARSNGQMHVYRTRKIGNTKHDKGWLSSLMYDEWTRTKVPPSFAIGPQGAIYTFRWDSGQHGKLSPRTLGIAHRALGIDTKPMRDFDDAALMSKWGIRHSIIYMDLNGK